MIPRQISLIAERKLAELARLVDTTDPNLPSAHVVVQAAAAAEGYVDELLDELIRREPNPSMVYRVLLDDYSSEMHRNWAGRFSWLRRGFKIDISSESEYGYLWDLVELRNALVHGGGRFTSLQSNDLLKRMSLEKRMAATLAVDVSGAVLIASSRTGALSIKVAREAILCLERASS